MVKVEFTGSVEEVKKEIIEFIEVNSIGAEVKSVQAEEKTEKTVAKIEEKDSAQKLPTAMGEKVVAVPMQAAEPVLPTLPTAGAEYTNTDIQRIAGGLIKKNATLKDTLINTLGNYGVQAITQLPKEHYGAFVQDLIALGADV